MFLTLLGDLAVFWVYVTLICSFLHLHCCWQCWMMCLVSTSVRRPGSFPGGSGVELTSQVSDTSALGVNMAEYVLGSSPHNSRLPNISHRYVSMHTDHRHCNERIEYRLSDVFCRVCHLTASVTAVSAVYLYDLWCSLPVQMFVSFVTCNGCYWNDITTLFG